MMKMKIVAIVVLMMMHVKKAVEKKIVLVKIMVFQIVVNLM